RAAPGAGRCRVAGIARRGRAGSRGLLALPCCTWQSPMPAMAQDLLEIRGQRRFPAEAFARRRVAERQGGGVQEQAPRAALVRQRRSVERTVVDALAGDRGAALAEMDADLVR